MTHMRMVPTATMIQPSSLYSISSAGLGAPETAACLTHRLELPLAVIPQQESRVSVANFVQSVRTVHAIFCNVRCWYLSGGCVQESSVLPLESMHLDQLRSLRVLGLSFQGNSGTHDKML